MSELPIGWENTSLKEVCDVIRGITFPASAKEENLLSSNVCCLRTTNIQREIDWNNIYFISREYVKRQEQVVQIGDILMSMANSYELVGKVAIAREVPFPTAFGAFLAAIRPTSRINGKFLFHLLRSNRVQELLRIGSSQTVNIANISIKTLSEIAIQLPPLNEQKFIADKLDTLLAAVDACRARLDKVPTLIKRFRQSVLAAATSGALTEDWRIQHQCNSTEENGFPIVLFGSLLKSIRGGSSEVPSHDASNFPVLRSSSVRQGEINFLDVKYLTEGQSTNSYNFIENGDILFTRLNGTAEYVGNCVVVTDVISKKYQYPDRLFCAKIKDGISSAYCMYAFSSPDVRHEIETRAKSTAGHKRISIQDIKEIEIRLPILEEQNEIVCRVKALFAVADKLEASLVTARKRVDQLTPSILAQAFRGELVEQDPNDEPASVLLARIADAAVPKRALKKVA